MNILRTKKCNVMKYTTFCRGINWECLASLKKIKWNINNIDNQLDAKITAYSLWYNAPMMLPATGRQHRGCIIPQAVTHILVLLNMGKIIARNMLIWLELIINPYCCIYLVVYIIYISDARSRKYQIMKYICWLNI